MKVMDFIRLTRPHYSLSLSGGLLVIAAYVCGGDFSLIGLRLLWAWAALYCLLAAAYIHNDICDIECDRINCPDRGLPSNRVSMPQAWLGAGLVAALGVVLAIGGGWRYVAVYATVGAGLVLYNRFSKKTGLLKNVFAALLTTGLYPLALSLAEPVQTPRLAVLALHPAWLFLTTLSYQMLKDVRDATGDSGLAGKIPTLIRLGKPFIFSARIIALIAGLITLFPYGLGWCHEVYLVSSILAILLALGAMFCPLKPALTMLYLDIIVITLGSGADLLVYGP